MTDSVTLRVDGRSVAADEGITVAAALETAGVRALRRSVSGQPRGVFCAMGICFECRVTIDGVAHRRACVEPVRGGMEIATRSEGAGAAASAAGSETHACDVVVVGAGPAGIAAACRAAESGARTVVLDEGIAPGGQIHRHLPGRPAPPAAGAWLARLDRSGAEVRSRASVFDADRDTNGWSVVAESPEGRTEIRARSLVLATGARELFLPFPGWTLPGVLGAGGAQSLWKSGASLAGRTAVVAGSGPLLLPAAASLTKAGARVAIVAEQAGLLALGAFAAGLLRDPRKLVEAARHRRGFAATRYRTGTWIAEALGDESVERVVLTDGTRRYELPCDLAAVSYGLVPSTELARSLGCEIRRGRVAVDSDQRTSEPGIFCAGEPCGAAGIEGAIAEGEIAGLAAAGCRSGDSPDSRRLTRARGRSRRLGAKIETAFRPRPELRDLARADTVVCRCEDVSRGRLEPCASAREAKLSARAGMGACQGRVCGPALAFLFGWASDTVRSPIQPAALGNLGSQEDLA